MLHSEIEPIISRRKVRGRVRLAGGCLFSSNCSACAINSEVGQRYLGSMRAAINCALANREILGHFARRVFAHFFPSGDLPLFDVSHNTASRNPWAGANRESCCASKGRHPGLRSRATRACPRRFVPSASPCWSAAAWRRARTFWWVRRLPSSACHGCRPGAFPPCRAQAVERDARLSMAWHRRGP